MDHHRTTGQMNDCYTSLPDDVFEIETVTKRAARFENDIAAVSRRASRTLKPSKQRMTKRLPDLPGPYINLRRERPVDRTPICNRQQPGVLFSRQGSIKLNVAFNPVNLSFLGFALGTIGCVDLEVTKPYRHLLERPTFAPGVHGDRHGGAGAERPQQQIIRRRPRLSAAHGFRFISQKTV